MFKLQLALLSCQMFDCRAEIIAAVAQVFFVFEPGQVAGTVCLRHVAVVYVADPVMEEARFQINDAFFLYKMKTNVKSENWCHRVRSHLAPKTCWCDLSMRLSTAVSMHSRAKHHSLCANVDDRLVGVPLSRHLLSPSRCRRSALTSLVERLVG